jgi:outer membrane protein OmpA-like peptidoglycan-associated protein
MMNTYILKKRLFPLALVAVLMLMSVLGCKTTVDNGNGALSGDAAESNPASSRIVGAEAKDNQPGGYHWEGDSLYVAEGTAIQFLGDSAIPERVHAEGRTLDLRFATVVNRTATITFDGLNTDSVAIALPKNFSFVVTYDNFQTTMNYDGAWGGNYIGGLQYSLSGSGQDMVFDSDNPNKVTFNFINGSSGSVKIYNLETVQISTGGPNVPDNTTVITLTADVLFEFGKSDLTPGARDEITDILDKIPQGAKVTVDGHTDPIGGDVINVPLSEARAQTVADVLREARPDLTLTVAGHSSHQPVAPNEIEGQDNPAGRALNRRVEISFPSS